MKTNAPIPTVPVANLPTCPGCTKDVNIAQEHHTTAFAQVWHTRCFDERTARFGVEPEPEVTEVVRLRAKSSLDYMEEVRAAIEEVPWCRPLPVPTEEIIMPVQPETARAFTMTETEYRMTEVMSPVLFARAALAVGRAVVTPSTQRPTWPGNTIYDVDIPVTPIEVPAPEQPRIVDMILKAQQEWAVSDTLADTPIFAELRERLYSPPAPEPTRWQKIARAARRAARSVLHAAVQAAAASAQAHTYTSWH